MDAFANEEKYLENKLKSPSAIKLYRDGEEFYLSVRSGEGNAVLVALARVNEGGYEMPALGVSLDRLTKEEMKKGLWVEFLYDEAEEHRDMPFDSLLIRVEAADCGYNVVRGVDGTYDGRVYYYSLEKGKNMSELRDALDRVTLAKNGL